MPKDLRKRAKSLLDRVTRPATQLGTRRIYPPGASGSGIGWCVLRVTTATELWVQRVTYANTTPVEGDVTAIGQFVRAYPPPGVAYVQYAPTSGAFTRPLLNATTQLAITENPDPDNPIEGQYEVDLAAFEAALAAETLGIKFYPFALIVESGVNQLLMPVWADEHLGFYNERAAMSEGSGS